MLPLVPRLAFAAGLGFSLEPFGLAGREHSKGDTKRPCHKRGSLEIVVQIRLLLRARLRMEVHRLPRKGVSFRVPFDISGRTGILPIRLRPMGLDPGHLGVPGRIVAAGESVQYYPRISFRGRERNGSRRAGSGHNIVAVRFDVARPGQHAPGGAHTNVLSRLGGLW